MEEHAIVIFNFSRDADLFYLGCDPSCATCNNDDPNSCLSCNSPAQLVGGACISNN